MYLIFMSEINKTCNSVKFFENARKSFHDHGDPGGGGRQLQHGHVGEGVRQGDRQLLRGKGWSRTINFECQIPQLSTLFILTNQGDYDNQF